MAWEKWLAKNWLLFVIIGIAVNSLGLLSPIIEPDGALYATLAKNMVLSNNYQNMTLQGNDWLDKPHFQFWVTAFCFKIFGINTIGYKLPAFLFWLLGAFYTYRFAQLFYSKTIAQLSVLIYLTAFHLVLSNNDVRAEPYLTGLIIAAIYHCYRGVTSQQFLQIVWCSLFTAAAIMTKGIFALIIIFSGPILHWLFSKQLNWSFIKSLSFIFFLTLVFITPEILSLYFQFDVHPEKIVFGHTHTSGIKFFFWDSQFGRFFNTGPIRGEGDPFFFLHTSLWAFFPWSILFFVSVFQKIKNIKTDNTERITLFGTIITFLLFSLSKFQLPHYLNIVFPLMCILTAQFILSIKKEKWTVGFLALSTVLCFIIVLFLAYFSLPQLIWQTCVVLIIILFLFLKFSNENSLVRWTSFAYCSSLMMYAFINLFLVPTLMQYESGLSAANFLNTKNISSVVMLRKEDESYSLDFYFHGEIVRKNIEELNPSKPQPLIYCNEVYFDSLTTHGFHPQVIQSFPYYKVSQPPITFLNAATRDKFPQHYLLVKTQ